MGTHTLILKNTYMHIYGLTESMCFVIGHMY